MEEITRKPKVQSKKADKKSAPSVSRKLNPQQVKFCKSRAKGNSATQAAIDAGYSKHTARQIGSKLLTKANINARVEVEAKKVQAKLDYKDFQHFEDLGRMQQFAENKGDFATALKALVQKGKLCGLYVEKMEASLKVPVIVDDIEDEEEGE